MKIFGLLRGFPGLGRVMSGITLLSALRDLGHEVKAYSYLQGLQALKDHGLDLLQISQPPLHQIMSLGLNPICNQAQALVSIILDEKPDLVIVDGEALFVSTLALVYPRERIMSLLNPMDVYNEALPVCTIRFYHTHYFAAGSAIVHGIDKDEIVVPEDTLGCKVLRTNTIIRRNILNIKPHRNEHKIVAILGGGSQNASDQFVASTMDMARRIVEAARRLEADSFTIYCNDPGIAEKISAFNVPANLSIVAQFTLPEEIYTTAGVVICRAGRNTISELLYLDLPGILMSTAKNFRATEQSKNIMSACSFRAGRLLELQVQETSEQLVEKIERVRKSTGNAFNYLPGNDQALNFVLQQINQAKAAALQEKTAQNG